ncbi:FAD-dependent oxidoreductase [Marihabitans asiaticum]|uniref:UDP-galactopyranose mutase n=1 Tax=Marihabitans asiaticum TaxID=415218 RepID=A0A560WE78_9MICO|nr:FAD-dependent oxidoreductase [Marihabitans asiaticum]TWD15834.1 UDP-galactopyranose mutase [Marihabitans asiaticum]
MTSERYDLVVVGAGPAGLATALLAARAGRTVLVLEREDRSGGMAASERIDGVRVDRGSHRLHPATPPTVLALLRELLGDDLQVRPRRGRVHLHGRWLHFPLRPVELARRMPAGWLARVARDAVGVGLSAAVAAATTGRSGSGRPGPQSYAEALTNSLGPTAYGELYRPYAEKLWGVPGEEIDPEQARVRVSADSVPKVAARLLRTSLARVSTRRRAGEPGPRGTTFYYPRRGFGQIVEALETAARECGAQILHGVQVSAIRDGDPVLVDAADGRRWQTPTVLSTIPVAALPRLVTPSPAPEVLEHARSLRSRAMVLVYLTHRPEQPPAGRPARWTPFDAHYLPARRTPVSRISEPANYRESAADPADRSVVCAEIPCEVGDELWSSSDEQLQALVEQALRDHDLPPIRTSSVSVRRLSAVYPVYLRGYGAHLDAVEAWARGLVGVTTLGRGGLFAHDNTHHALVMAQAVVDCLGPDGRLEPQRWATAREGFRSHVVED